MVEANQTMVNKKLNKTMLVEIDQLKRLGVTKGKLLEEQEGVLVT
jgi:hypothetical protein